MADYNPNNPYNQKQYNQNSQSTSGGSFSSTNSTGSSSGGYTPNSSGYTPNSGGYTPSGSGYTPNSSQGSTSRDDQLKKLGQQLNQNQNKKKKGGRWVIILLILLLVGLAVVAVWYFLQGKANIEEGGTIRISMDLPEEMEGVVGDIYKPDNKISPGDKYDVVCRARNANNYGGDSSDVADQTPIYIRFKVTLIVDNKEYYGMVKPNPVEGFWHTYNKSEEAEDYVWDNYYYYYGKLNYNASVELFDTLTFDFKNIPNEFGGKTGQIVITIEAVEANKDIIGVDGGAWESAPKTWSTNMKNGVNNNGQSIEV